MSRKLVTRGRAVVRLGIPHSPNAPRQEFAKALRKFDRALARFRTDAIKGSDTKLKKSFSAVHDSFEHLSHLVAETYPPGLPPTLSLNCPSKSEAGSEITLTADIVGSDKLAFIWTLSGGEILAGQRTRTITVDTTGLAGETICVTVTVDDGNGHLASTDCKVEVSASELSRPVSGVNGAFAKP